MLNGERVEFEGPPPSTRAEVWALLEGFLGQSGMHLDQFIVDGATWDPDSGADEEPFTLIEAHSVSAAQNVARIARALLDGRADLLDRWKTGAANALIKPWAQFQGDGLEILNATEPLAQSVALLTEYSKQSQQPWSEEIERAGERFNESLSLLMDAFEAGDCIAYSDIAATSVYPAIDGVCQTLSSSVLPTLKEADSG